MSGRTRRAGSLLILAALAAVPLASLPGPATGGASGSPSGSASNSPPSSMGGSQAKSSGTASSAKSKAPPKRTNRLTVDLPAGHPLPDSIVAVIDDARVISAGDFRRGWGAVLPPARPDTLTPETARQFLDLLVNKELLAARAGAEDWEWTAVESAQVAGLRDRTMMRVALDSALAAFVGQRAARGDSALRPEALGVAARESTVAHLEVRYEEQLLERLARSWGSLPKPSTDSSLWSRLKTMGQMPAILPADSGRVVAWSTVGTVRVTELLDAWAKLNPLFRPRIESTEQVRDLVKNALFERVLRRQAVQGHYDLHPTVQRAVRRQEEYLASQYYVTREVFAAIPTDDATLRRYYDKDPSIWAVPTRLRIVRMLMPDRSEASRMAVRLRDQAEADTLVARGLRQRVNYTAEISAADDSVLFRAAMKSGTGTVLGPDSTRGGWQVVRVHAVLPGQTRSFDEVKELVLRAWSDEESERRMTALLASLRKRSKVVVNRAAIDKLVSAVPAPRTR